MRFIRSGKAIGGVALAAAFVFGGTVAVAQQPEAGRGQGERQSRQWGGKGFKGGKGHHRGGRGFLGGRMAERLNLTDAQKEQLQQIAARHRESMKALRRQGGLGRQGRGANGFEGTFNESEVRAAAQARANASVELAVVRARMMSEMYNVLTPEQKTQLAAERQQREQRRQERRQQREQRRNAAGASQTE
ncbi:MAG TPA: Spy/CpxP family protein refolding chaperone [Pyrinomonadaceae bacterium]|nr:Spy/CpxP family protein refolding chaperone [Pyrinomonadaceae bacterium]